MGIILGLAGAVCWGVADFLARFSSRRVGAYRTLLFMQAFGFVGLSVYLKWTHRLAQISAHGWQPWAFGAIAGLLNMVASLALYYSFQIGVMSVVAPVSSSYPALTVMLALLSGEHIQALRGSRPRLRDKPSRCRAAACGGSCWASDCSTPRHSFSITLGSAPGRFLW